uniref:Alpha-taxilin n=1 Tax=Macrostomum lignano TaxID=282301 RepID=A0A1I8J6N3_9PLAT
MSMQDAQQQSVLSETAREAAIVANLESQLESLLASEPTTTTEQANLDEAQAATADNNDDTTNSGDDNGTVTIADKEKSSKDSSSKSKSKKSTSAGAAATSRSFDYVMRSLANLSTEEKIDALAKKYAEVYDQGRASAEKLKATQKQLTVVSRERDQLQSEHSKAMLAKSKLEGLCRELQKHYKVVKDESISRAKEEEEKRKEVSGQLQTTISDIQSQMQEHNVRNTKLREENATLVEKMQSLVEKYEKREEYVEKLLRQHDLQAQLAEARLAQEKAQGEAERARFYTAKYDDFQNAIGKSNEMFATFKTQIDGLTKKMRQLEKERNQWRERCEGANSTVLQMAQDKAENEALVASLRVKIDTLEKLCPRASSSARRFRRSRSR